MQYALHEISMQTMRFMINLSLIKFKRGLARLMYPQFRLCLNYVGISDDDCQYYENEVVLANINHKGSHINIFADLELHR